MTLDRSLHCVLDLKLVAGQNLRSQHGGVAALDRVCPIQNVKSADNLHDSNAEFLSLGQPERLLEFGDGAAPRLEQWPGTRAR
ncbi:MAG TPA: hypothetical protein VNF26_08580 [Candidatus Baltobacterales bacterium]|nr:hypothetical protein [Candidatus Baltobacterales bacterium]